MDALGVRGRYISIFVKKSLASWTSLAPLDIPCQIFRSTFGQPLLSDDEMLKHLEAPSPQFTELKINDLLTL